MQKNPARIKNGQNLLLNLHAASFELRRRLTFPRILNGSPWMKVLIHRRDAFQLFSRFLRLKKRTVGLSTQNSKSMLRNIGEDITQHSSVK